MKKKIILSSLSAGLVLISYSAIAAFSPGSRAASTEPVEPPYSNTIEKNSLFNKLITEDANNDGFTWYFLGGTAHNRYNWQDRTIPADDYLYTPGISLEKNAKYVFEADINNGFSTTRARVGFVVATAPEHTAVVSVIMTPRLFTQSPDKWEHCSAEFVAPEKGTYYFGVWDCSDANGYGPSVKNISVSAPVFMDGPAAVSDLKATPDPDGNLSVILTYTAPVKTMTGQELTSISRVDIYRDEELIDSQEPTPGETMSYTDSGASRGEHTYRLVTVNEYGEGDSATVSTFVGFDWPLEPTDIHARRGSNNGEIIVSWTPPVKDQNGLTFPEGAVTYEVYRIVDKSAKLIAENYKDTEITDQAVMPDGRNSIVQYQIISKYKGQGGNFDCTGIITVGLPYALPFIESVPQGKTTHNWRTYQDLNSPARWYGATDANVSGCNSQDGDNGYFLFDGGSQPDHSATIISSAIKIGAEDTPILSFYLFKVANATQNAIKIWIRDCSDPEGEFSVLKEVSMGEGYTLNWNRQEISLADYAGMEIQLAFEGIIRNFTYGMIDNIRVENPSAVELKSEILTGPGKAFAGSPVELTSYFVNNGIEESGDFQVILYRDNNIVDEVEVKSIAPGTRSSVTFEQKTPVIYTGEVKFKTEIVSEKDADPANNTSNVLSVFLEEPSFPVPLSLVGTSKDDDVHLSWSAPSNEDNTERNPVLTDDFETYPSFAKSNAGLWKFHDLDGKGTGGIQGLEFPGQNIGEPASWLVFDKLAIPGFNPNAFEMISGSKCLAVLYNYQGEPNDDWLVSPQLSGRQQDISFYALALGNNIDRIEIMVSTTDDNPESFTKLYEVTDFLTRWRKYTAPLPEGTKYFALRYCSANGTAIFVDDISYEAYVGALDSDLSGYNVYRNGEIINSEPVAECSYVDEAPSEGMYMYHVTALYGENESSPCDYVFVAHKPSGVFDAESVASHIHIEGNTLTVTTEDDNKVEIYTLSGVKLTERQGSFSTTLSSGVYLVSIHGKVIKINI